MRNPFTGTITHRCGETTMGTAKKTTSKVKDLKGKKVSDKKAQDVKGGRMPFKPKG